MGCFLACFGSSKDRKHRKIKHNVQLRDHQRNTRYSPVQSKVCSAQECSEKPLIPVSEFGVKAEEQLSCSGTRRKVTFDSNVKTYEHVSSEEVTVGLPESDQDEKEEKVDENLVKSNQSQSCSEDSSITSSSGSFTPNHRYHNCRESDDEDDGLDLEDSDLDDDDDDDDDYDYEEEEDIYEDDNNMIVESRIDVDKVDTREVDSSLVTSGLDEGGVKPIGANQNARDRSAYVHSVLNPVENLSQWKAVKAKGKPQFKQRKENFTVDQEPRASFSLEPSFKELSFSFKTNADNQSKKSNQEIAVDASLSNWLSSSETTPVNKSSSISLNATPEKIRSHQTVSHGSNSLRSQEDRPILGALTLEEIRQFSASSSPRKSPSRSPDEMPIIGTVGSYWSPTSNANDSGSVSSYKGIPNTTSKYREDKKVNWYSTPFETRLERALNRGAAEGHSTQYS